MTGIIIIDKAGGWTSMDVCARLRRLLGERRIGHGGTLDPMATGVLPVFVGRATRAAEFAENAEKRYTARLRLGIETDTEDITGAVLSSCQAFVTQEQLLGVLKTFIGEQQQVPPMYSAVKVGGRKLYELARRGESVERAPRTVTIKDIQLLGEEDGDFLLDVTCSKGTYIRTLCADIGKRLGCGAVMSGLRRTAAGAYTLADAVTLETVEEKAVCGEAESLLRPVDSMFSRYRSVTVSGKAEKACRNGGGFAAGGLQDGLYRVYSASGEFLMLGRCKNGEMSTEKSFFEVN